ncbi:MAG: radical SAM family heme chaperone HemW [Rhodospirillales bacterium]
MTVMAPGSAPEVVPEVAALSVYIHWPFCLAKCPYCDFNSHVAAGIDQAVWRQSYLREIEFFAAELGPRRLVSVFFGGGTPSLMDPGTAGAILERLGRHFTVAADCEITLEANPTSVEAGRFRDLRRAGVNRLSLGVQALDDADLRHLGRHHSVEEALAAVRLAAQTFNRFSFDLIYGRPGQTADLWASELDQALELGARHLSLYQLTIEPGTVFHRDRHPEVAPDLGADLYDLTQAKLAAAGLPAYEISNHAQPGEACRHNLVYWQGGAYLGIGPGAHGRLRIDDTWEAHHQFREPARWLTKVAEVGHGTHKRFSLSLDERREELLLGGLRLTDGLDADSVRRALGLDLTGLLQGLDVEPLVAGGFLELTTASLRATPAGRLRLNAVLARLLGA